MKQLQNPPHHPISFLAQPTSPNTVHIAQNNPKTPYTKHGHPPPHHRPPPPSRPRQPHKPPRKLPTKILPLPRPLLAPTLLRRHRHILSLPKNSRLRARQNGRRSPHKRAHHLFKCHADASAARTGGKADAAGQSRDGGVLWWHEL